AEDVVGRVRPRCALIALVAGEKIEEQARLIEVPLARALLAALEDLAEELLRLSPTEEHVLPRRVVVAVARRDHDALDPEAHRIVEEIRDVVGILARIERAVRRDPEAALPRELDRVNRLVERAGPAHGLVVPLAVAVEMHGPREIRRRLVVVDLLLEQQRVRAEIDELLARDDAANDLRHLLVNQRLPARNRDDRRAALVDGAQRILDAHALLQDIGRIVDLAAPGAREVALEQGLEHQHQRIALHALQLLLQDVARDPVLLYEWNAHSFSFIRQKVSDTFVGKGCPPRSLGARHLFRFALPVRAGAFQHRVEEIAPDVRPLHLEPRREPLGCGLELRLERVDAYPAPIRNLADVDVDRAVVAAVVNPAIFVLGA